MSYIDYSILKDISAFRTSIDITDDINEWSEKGLAARALFPDEDFVYTLDPEVFVQAVKREDLLDLVTGRGLYVTSPTFMFLGRSFDTSSATLGRTIEEARAVLSLVSMNKRLAIYKIGQYYKDFESGNNTGVHFGIRFAFLD